MRWIRTICLLAAVLGTHAVFAQIDAKDLEQTLKAKQQWELRSFSAEPVAKYKWVDGKLVGDPVQTHTLGVFTAESLKLKDGKLTIRGSRSTLVHDSKADRVLASGKSAMALEIDMGGAPFPLMSDDLVDALFFPDLQAAIDALPERMKTMLPLGITGPPQAAKCNCFRFFDDGHWSEVPKDVAGAFQEPRLIKNANPEFTEEARIQKFNGTVTVTFLVTSKGAVEDVWVSRAVGMGLDENAAAAVRKYQFEPAKYDGHAVGVELSAVVNFQVF